MLRSWSVRVDVYHMVKKTYHVLTKCVGTVITSSVCRVFIFKDTGSCHPVPYRDLRVSVTDSEPERITSSPTVGQISVRQKGGLPGPPWCVTVTMVHRSFRVSNHLTS